MDADDLRYHAAFAACHLRRYGYDGLADLLDQLAGQGGRDCDTVRGRMAALPAALAVARDVLGVEAKAERDRLLAALRGGS